MARTLCGSREHTMVKHAVVRAYEVLPGGFHQQRPAATCLPRGSTTTTCTVRGGKQA